LATVTIYLNGTDEDIKQMIRDLKNSRRKGNPYVGRSESEIAKMLLLIEVGRQHKRLCGTERRQARSKG